MGFWGFGAPKPLILREIYYNNKYVNALAADSCFGKEEQSY